MDNEELKGNASMIEKSMEVLELLANHPKGLTLQEMVTLLGYPKSSVYKIANTLYSLNYLGKELDSLKYYLSRKLLKLGISAVSGYDIIERSQEHMKRLRDQIGESIMIGTLLDQEALLLNQIQGSIDFVFTLKQGMRFSLHSTAPGKVLLAFLHPEAQKAKLNTLQLDAINEYTITDKELLRQELDRILAQGYAADVNETVKGVHCVAAPIFDESNQVIACVWTSGPAGRLPEEQIPAIARLIMDCGMAISYNIGYKKEK
ncbi:IclR family transcriptional regulator [Mucilaginibacter sp. Bleaf8]|uniref:IclR family transcriptional regulator n=1 Tax=Mucilaginibacter sp. Bleaf8 TaxID=2834430 RepID=UPI001BCDA8F6|nr:IclR family transcriptional regulator [Mucilaginibacter sp. Bleaf8]MBS7565946.1 IclR family transcriptional regulator [Mucilaginibacter sp. Bleaf8]